MSGPSLRLSAAPSPPGDAGGNVVRLPSRAFEVLGLEEGDPVALVGRIVVWARARSARTEDEGLDVARVPPEVRGSLGVEEGAPIRVRAACVRPARAVEVETGPEAAPTEGETRDFLSGHTILEGDVFRLPRPGESRGFDVDLSVGGLRLLGMSGRLGEEEETRIRIIATDPGGPVSLTRDTAVRIRPRDDPRDPEDPDDPEGPGGIRDERP